MMEKQALRLWILDNMAKAMALGVDKSIWKHNEKYQTYVGLLNELDVGGYEVVKYQANKIANTNANVSSVVRKIAIKVLNRIEEIESEEN